MFVWFGYIVTRIIILPVRCLLYIVPWFWYPSPSALVLVMIRMWYIYSLLKLVAFHVYDKLCPSSWHRYLYVGGSWTGNSNRPYCREVKFSWRRKQLLEGKNKKIEEEKMILELHVADVVDDHKIKMDAMRLKIRKIRKYAIHTEAWYHYAVGSIVTLVAIMIAFVFALKCFT